MVYERFDHGDAPEAEVCVALWLEKVAEVVEAVLTRRARRSQDSAQETETTRDESRELFKGQH